METSAHNSGHSGASKSRGSGDGSGGSYRSGGGSIMSTDPPEIGGDHYYRHRDNNNDYNNNNNNRHDPSDAVEDDEEELRSLATMDTNTYRRLREKRHKKSKESDTEKAKGSDNEGRDRSSTMRHRSQQRLDPRGGRQRDTRVRYRGGGHGRNSFDEDDHTDGGSNGSTSWMTDEGSRFSRSTNRSNRLNRSHSSSITSHQWQMLLIFALGLVLIIKAGIVEVKLEKTQLRGIRDRVVRGGNTNSHLDHSSGGGYFEAPTVMNARSLVEEVNSDAAEEDSPSETYFKEAVKKLENGGGFDSQGEYQKTEDGVEDQQIEQDLEDAADEGKDDLNENYSTEEQQQQQPDLQQQQQQQQQLFDQSQTQLVGNSPAGQQLLTANFQQSFQGGDQQSGEQIQQSQQQGLFVQQQQQQPQPYQQTQFGYQQNQFGKQQLPGHYPYGQQQAQYGQQQNQFSQQINQQNYLQYGQQPGQVLPQQVQQQPQYNHQQQFNQQQNLQAPQQFEPQLQQDVQQQVFAVQSSNEVASPPGQIGNVGNEYLNANSNEAANPPEYASVGNVDAIEAANTDPNNDQSDAETQLQQQFEPQLQQDVQQYVQQQAFGLQSSNEVASPLDQQIGNVGNDYLNANSNEAAANPPEYAPVGNVYANEVANADPNNGQSGAEAQLQQQFEPQLQQDVQQQAFGVQSSNEVASPPDQQIGNVGNEGANAPDYAPVGNVDAIESANADPNNGRSDSETYRNPVAIDSAAPNPPTDILNNRIVPFDISREPRFRGSNKGDDDEDSKEAVEDVPVQVEPDAYGTLKEVKRDQQESRARQSKARESREREASARQPRTREQSAREPRVREPRPDPSNPDFNYKAAVVDDGIAFTNPRLWGAKTLTTPGLRIHLNKNDAKFAPAAV